MIFIVMLCNIVNLKKLYYNILNDWIGNVMFSIKQCILIKKLNYNVNVIYNYLSGWFLK